MNAYMVESLCLGRLDGFPHAVGRCGHVKSFHAQGRSASSTALITAGGEPMARLAATLGAQRVVGAGRAHMAELELGEVISARHGVVHEAAGEQLAGFAVVHAVFHQRLAQCPAPARHAPGPPRSWG